MIYDTVILGAGASGLMAAAHLNSRNVLILEGNTKAAQKLKISGGGRCNITNEFVEATNFLADRSFIGPILDAFDNDAVMAYFHARGLETVVEKNHQYFCRNSSQDLIDILLDEVRHASIRTGETVMKVDATAQGYAVTTTRESYHAKRVIVATGGASFPKIGASRIGLDIAESFGIPYRDFEPALVGLTLQQEQAWMKDLSGISCMATVTVGKKSFTDWLLFAHKGISGPAVLSASLYWKRSSIIIDFLPNRKLKQLLKDPKKQLSSQLPLPKRLVKSLLEALGVEDKALGKLSEVERERLSLIKSYNFAPAGNFGLSKAEACRGGVLTEELNLTLESKKYKGLYFIGEVVDVTGELGGYNFQWAFASAVAAAKAINMQVTE